MPLWNPDKYTAAWNYASIAHNGQFVPGTTLPYINHIANVTMEVMTAIATTPSIENPDLSVQCALLHDTIEDTDTTFDVLSERFGKETASGVLALSKDKALASKAEQMDDSLARIRKQPVEVWMVKLADRITNLQPPPSHWSREKTVRYHEEAKKILHALGSANVHLAARLQRKINHYDIMIREQARHS